jgi:hypothetical protein
LETAPSLTSLRWRWRTLVAFMAAAAAISFGPMGSVASLIALRLDGGIKM